MREFIGSCSCCGKDLFCLDGFFNGVYTNDQKLLCFDCQTSFDKEENPQS